MARQAGPLYFTGTIDDLTFYKMEGQYFARKKTSLDRKQFRTDPRFKRSRASAAKFGEASKLASQVYQLLPKEARGKGVIGKLTSQVGQLFKEGKDDIQIIEHFKQLYTPVAPKPASQTQTKETAVLPAPLSDWKITAMGKLISEKASLSLITDFSQAPLNSHKQKNNTAPLHCLSGVFIASPV